MLLFVYGTLMTGECYHHYLDTATHRGPARTVPGYILLNPGRYPALVEGGKGSVRGELYDVDGPTLALLDDLEETPTLYRRVQVETDQGLATTYLLAALPDPSWPAIPSGDWRDRP
jgi:gamma-glutamylcyclotransferase (GGCT)/AIG2-like uncharacterized protein YtfP